MKQWAPLIWLAPNETFYPGNAEDYLENTRLALADNSKLYLYKNLSFPIGPGSEQFFLIPKSDFGIIQTHFVPSI